MVRPVQSTILMMANSEQDLSMVTTVCWCGRHIDENEKRHIFGVTWCSDCFQRILRACPRALRNARMWVDDEEP